MNKVELASKVAEVMTETGVKTTKKAASEYVDTIVDVIKETLASGEDVKIAGLGAFTVVERAERMGVNPQHPETKITIPACKAVKFKAASALKASVKGE